MEEDTATTPGTLEPMGRLVETSEIRLHRVDHGGEGPGIVLVHGLGGSTVDWDAVAPALTEAGRVTAVDLPRFGLSPPAPSQNVDGIADALAEFAEAYAAETGGPVALIGNSLGGLVSTLAAARRPDDISALVLVSPAFPPRLRDLGDLHWPTTLRLVLQTAPLTGEALNAWLRAMSPRDRVFTTLEWISHKPGRVPMPVIESLVEMSATRRSLPWARRSVTATSRSIAATWAKRSQIVEAVRAVRAPTLVIQGREDRLIAPVAVRSICDLRPDWDLVIMEDTGHVPQLDAPLRFAELVVPWLRARL